MRKNILFKITAVVIMLFLLGACDLFGTDDPADPASSDWDSLQWDQDSWS